MKKKKSVITLKRKRLLKNIFDPNCKSLREAATKAGYNPRTLYIYRESIRKHIIDALEKKNFGAEDIKDSFKKLQQLATIDGDYSNANRSSENLTRILGLYVDKTEIHAKIEYTHEEKEEYKRLRGGVLSIN